MPRPGHSALGLRALDRVLRVHVRQGVDGVDHSPADQEVMAGDRAFRRLLDLGDDLLGGPLRVLGLQESRHAGHVRRGEARAVVGAVAAAGDSGDHVDAGGCDSYEFPDCEKGARSLLRSEDATARTPSYDAG